MRKKLLRKVEPYLYIAPHLFFFLVFLVIPAIYGFWISLHDWDYLSEPKFVGFRNYVDLFVNKEGIDYTEFWNAMGNTVEFVFYSVPVLVAVPLLFALAIHTGTWGNRFFRAVFYAPFLLSVATVSLIWLWLLDTNAGLVNYGLYFLGIRNIPWLNELPWVWISLVAMTVWWTIGRNMVVFLAGLQEIPRELHEAARIDGAGAVNRFFHVTLPGLKGPVLFNVVMTTIESFNLFGQPFMTTRGGPGTETQVLLMYIRETAFGQFRMGDAAAMAMVMGFFLLIVSIAQFWLLNRERTGKRLIREVK